MIRCLIADDQAMVREGFGALLGAQDGITVAGLAADGAQAVTLARAARPDEASGFLLKDAPAAELVRAVRVVAAGDALLAPSVTRRLIAGYARRPPPAARTAALGQLTPRETEVLALIARGLSNTEISEHLVIAEQTAKTHVGRILMKLALRDRAQAVVFAYESGLVTPGG